MGEQGFTAVVKYLSDKPDKSEAGKLVAASAHTTDAFKSVKSAMGEQGFTAVVKYLSDKPDKSEAGKLVAASAHTTDAFKSVKSAMGEQGFTAVVKYLSVHNHSQARSLVKSMTRKKKTLIVYVIF